MTPDASGWIKGAPIGWSVPPVCQSGLLPTGPCIPHSDFRGTSQGAKGLHLFVYPFVCFPICLHASQRMISNWQHRPGLTAGGSVNLACGSAEIRMPNKHSLPNQQPMPPWSWPHSLHSRRCGDGAACNGQLVRGGSGGLRWKILSISGPEII